MESGAGAREQSEIDTALERRLQRIHRIAAVSAVAWVGLVAVCTVLISDRITSRHLNDASERAERDAKAISAVVDRVFNELAAIPQVLSGNRDLRAIVTRYNARAQELSSLTPEERGRQLRNDPQIAGFGERLTQLRNRLNYDLVYVLDTAGTRVVSSEWDRPVSLLGERLDDRSYFRQAMAGKLGHDFAIARATKNAVFFFSAPILEDDKPIGAVVVRQDNLVIGSLLAIGRRTTMIVDNNGAVLASSEAAGQTTLRTHGPEIFRRLGGAKAGRVVYEMGGEPHLATLGVMNAAPYSLLTLTPINWIATAWREHYLIGALAAVFGVLLALFNDRFFSDLARRRHDAIRTAALNQRLTELNADKDRYLGIAAHDLRNPLTSMRGLSELMLEVPLEPEQHREFLETIHRTSNEMLGLVNDLLDTSVIESGKLSLRRADHDVAKLIQQRIRHLEPHARNKQIGIAFDAPGVQRASIDAARFGQVIDNLVSNAIKFSPAGTSVRVALQSQNGNFTFSVQDQGPGIREADRKLLFRSFQKLSARPTGGEKSTGLGLAIVKKIVDAHGGTIEVESGSGGGTRFTVTTPSASAGS